MVLAPVGYLVATEFISAFLLLDIDMGAAALGYHDLGRMMDSGLALLVAIIALSTTILAIYLLPAMTRTGRYPSLMYCPVRRGPS